MRLGTRGSALALTQARWVAERLSAAGETEVEIVAITTLGDRGAAIQDKSRWVSELERALLEDRIDLAVHSAKDVPTELDPGLELCAVPPRADARDAICGARSLDGLPEHARVGTSSLRRAAQLRALRPDLEIVALRGNVDTRLRKLAEGQADALVLAYAGLLRLGRAAEAGATLDALVPAAGQGALALEARTGAIDPERLRAVSDPTATACLDAERTLVHALGASCHTPVGALATSLDHQTVELTGWVGLPDGSAWLTDRVTGAPAQAGRECAERMLAAGAGDLLTEAERQVVAAGLTQAGGIQVSGPGERRRSA
ncbi:MAG TPA: hydroxymethylbilane synthase [Solirubrobacteraceae bacterium]|nr:hydroxymethylbilane synthase [Solirubrobacteraceae bacterium]